MDVNFAADEITFRITKGGVRTIPMIAEARELLERIRHERGDPAPHDRVMEVSEARASIDTAAAKIGIARFTHHDLRKLFATTAIEAGVDVPTVADWLGHLDGGALLLKTYRKAREEHSRRMAGKVSFGQPAGNVVAFSADSHG